MTFGTHLKHFGLWLFSIKLELIHIINVIWIYLAKAKYIENTAVRSHPNTSNIALFWRVLSPFILKGLPSKHLSIWTVVVLCLQHSKLNYTNLTISYILRQLINVPFAFSSDSKTCFIYANGQNFTTNSPLVLLIIQPEMEININKLSSKMDMYSNGESKG